MLQQIQYLLRYKACFTLDCGPPHRLSRKPTVDDAYRLRNIVAALTEIRESGTTEAARTVSVTGGRDRLPPEQEEREERLFELLSQVEDVRTLARAFQALEELLSNEPEESRTSLRHPTRVGTGHGSDVPATKSESLSSVPAKKTVAALSDSFHRRVCALCRERTDQVETAPSGSGSASGSPGSETAVDSERRELALAQLRFRACAYELYDLLGSVEVQPAGVGGGDDGGDPGFFPPGQRGWRYTSLAEETAAWVHMAKLAHKDQHARGATLASAELPDFQVGWGWGSHQRLFSLFGAFVCTHDRLHIGECMYVHKREDSGRFSTPHSCTYNTRKHISGLRKRVAAHSLIA